MNFFREVKQRIKAFCFNLIEELRNPISGYRVNFGKRRSRIKIDAITNATFENGKLVVNHTKMPIFARLNYWRIGLWQYFKTYPSVAYSLILLPITLQHPELFPLGVLLVGSIAYDAVSSSFASGVTSITFSHTRSGSNGGITVGVVSAYPVSSVTYAGVNLTKVVEVQNAANARYTSMWYLANPASGANNVVVTISSSGYIAAGAISFTGVSQTAMLDGYNSANSETNVSSISCNVTTSYANSFLVDVFRGAESPSPNSGQTQRYTQNGEIWGSTKPTTTAGVYSMGWSWSVQSQPTIVAMGVREAPPIYYQTCSETLVLSDTILKKPQRILSETLTLTSNLFKSTSRAFTETISLTATLLKLPSRVFSEVVALADTFNSLKIIDKVLSETISLTDTFARVLGFNRIFSETITLSDTIARSIGRTFTETVSLVGTLSKLVSKVFAETVSLADTIIKSAGKTLSEAVSLLDTIIRAVGRTFTETLHFIDIIITIVPRIKNVLLKALSLSPRGSSKAITPRGGSKIDKAN